MIDYLKTAIEIFVIFAIIYALFTFLRGTRGEGIIKGFTVLFVISFLVGVWLSRELGLYRIEYLLNRFFATSFFALVIIFQPELRNGLIRLGRNPFIKALVPAEEGSVEEICKAVEKLAKSKVGALIAIEREIGLGGFVERGVGLDSRIDADLLVTIFWPGSPLHDGAVIVRGDRVAAAGCLFPLTENPDVDKALGTRHRAAIGLTDETDALTIAVSEETGTVSVAERSNLKRAIDLADLENRLRDIYDLRMDTAAKGRVDRR